LKFSFNLTCARLPAKKSSPLSKSRVSCSGCWTNIPPFLILPPSPAPTPASPTPTPASPATPSPAPEFSMSSFFLPLSAYENMLADRGVSASNKVLSKRATMIVEYLCWHRSSALASTCPPHKMSPGQSMCRSSAPQKSAGLFSRGLLSPMEKSPADFCGAESRESGVTKAGKRQEDRCY